MQIVNLLGVEASSTFVNQNDLNYDGFIYNDIKKNKDYLYVSSYKGYLNIWDLYNKQLYKRIYIPNSKLNHIINWNDKYVICTDYESNSLKIIDINNNKAICDIKGRYADNIYLKKIYHPLYNESLLVSGNGTIQILSVNDPE